MANSGFINFVVNFSERGLAAVNSNANTMLGYVNRNLGTTQRQARYATQSLGEMNRQLNALRARRELMIDTRQITAANREIAQLEGRINNLSGTGGRAGGGMSGLLKGGLIAGGIAAAGYAAKQVVTDSIEAAMNYGTRLKSFEVLVGNATRGRALANELRDMKMNTLVGGGVYQNAQTMLGFGVNERSVTRKLREVGDVGMGDTDRMQSLALVRSQTTAAGKLMGQDLLQYINAGFNPLSVMAEHWKEFGFKTKQTVGTLKDLMEEGKISSEMVDKAFTVATSKGGRFYQMMDQIGETAGGKLLKLKGAWAATQIDIGNSLMPIAEAGMKAATSLLHFLHVGQSVPDSLRNEQAAANTLVGAITQLNEKSEVRARLIDELKAKYPEFYGEIDKEKTKNEELLKILNKVNDAYGKRIGVAEMKMSSQLDKEEGNRLLAASANALKLKAWRDGGMKGPRPIGLMEEREIGKIGVDYGFKYNESGAVSDMLLQFMVQAGAKGKQLMDKGSWEERNSRFAELVNEGNVLVNNPEAQKKLWGKSYGKNSAAFSKEWNTILRLQKETGNKYTGSLMNYDYNNLDKLLHPDTSSSDLTSSISDTGRKIAGGGNRQIIINLNAPMIKDQVFHVNSMAEAKEYSERDQEDILLRILQSAKAALG